MMEQASPLLCWAEPRIASGEQFKPVPFSGSAPQDASHALVTELKQDSGQFKLVVVRFLLLLLWVLFQKHLAGSLDYGVLQWYRS